MKYFLFSPNGSPKPKIWILNAKNNFFCSFVLVITISTVLFETSNVV